MNPPSPPSSGGPTGSYLSRVVSTYRAENGATWTPRQNMGTIQITFQVRQQRHPITSHQWDSRLSRRPLCRHQFRHHTRSRPTRPPHSERTCHLPSHANCIHHAYHRHSSQHAGHHLRPPSGILLDSWFLQKHQPHQ
jgi:hypothetical protein